ncbi:hypothetical protein VD0002_g3044 [Verticillium dahliae]|nr:hypothetical protein VD0002_g3044 [Verticillium dahliae]
MITPLVQSPASPADLLHYIVSYQTYPTTLLICASRADFLASLQQDIHAQLTTPALDTEPARTLQPTSASPLLQAPLYQVAVAKHIRIAFLPTVAHLRASLAAFSPHDPAKVAAPPTADGPPTAPGRRPPLLLVYGLLALHRETSEWSAQGIGSTAAGLVQSARGAAFRAVVVEPRREGPGDGFEALLGELAPALSGGSRRDEGGWTGRTVDVRRILGRWFRFQTGQWHVE